MRGVITVIEWVKFDVNNPPEDNTHYIVRSEYGWFDIGEIIHDVEDGCKWIDAHDFRSLLGITHYAKINNPV